MGAALAHRSGAAEPEIRARRLKPATKAQVRGTRASLRADMEKFVIEGGTRLSGTIVPAGNKNGALPILAACLLTEDEVTLRNVPKIRDVEAMMLLLEGLGAEVRWTDTGEVTVDASGVGDTGAVDRQLAERIRASFLLAGPLLARFGHVRMPPPGGDVIGRRRLDPHL